MRSEDDLQVPVTGSNSSPSLSSGQIDLNVCINHSQPQSVIILSQAESEVTTG